MLSRFENYVPNFAAVKYVYGGATKEDKVLFFKEVLQINEGTANNEKLFMNEFHLNSLR